MVIDSNTRKQLKAAKRVVNPTTVGFFQDQIVLLGEKAVASITVPSSLYDSLSIDNPIYVESDRVLPLLTTEGEFHVDPYKFSFSSKLTKASVNTTTNPLLRIPTELNADPRISFSVPNLKNFSRLLKFLSQASRLNSTSSIYRDRFFVTLDSGVLSLFASNGTIINTFDISNTTKVKQLFERRVVLPGKIMEAGTASLKASNNLLTLEFHDGLTVMNFDNGAVKVWMKNIMISPPDIHSAITMANSCGNELVIEKPSELQIPKEQSIGVETARYAVSDGERIQITTSGMNFTETHNSEETYQVIGSPLDTKLKYREFNLSLNCFLMRILFRWPSSNPAFVVLQDSEKMSIHSTNLGDN